MKSEYSRQLLRNPDQEPTNALFYDSSGRFFRKEKKQWDMVKKYRDI